MARRLDSEIKVLSNGDWIFRGTKIEQRDVLSYFRKNLKEAPDGVYIDNQYGDLSENGYVHLEGYPVNLIRVSEIAGNLTFLTDGGDELSLSELELSTDRDGILIAKKKGNRLLKFKIARNVSAELSKYIEETETGHLLRTTTEKRELKETSEGPEVQLPDEFRNES
ncbi:hypothetical protein LEP1GSC047_2813 [Leptospira inadai serovar Lyme str. 10]|uniref:PF06938 family protein n=2 Tax=Leptospira inadai serovar Lyme TaxID=293084 RepID=V6HUM2_9LEPT|nr:hypothetical protein [Leptospira inadai]EQA36479.1 hypothetical protein LEP1GSC047_2813 [Leptospira inadai serovar Lyme str. 10]PNV76413.1 hypothetical protein BES34_002075 [Leptospira inadai serovar Lyme]